MIDEPQGAFSCCSSTLAVLANFWPVSWAINHLFGVPERFPRLMTPGVHLHAIHQHSQFWPISGPFHGLLITILGYRCDLHA